MFRLKSFFFMMFFLILSTPECSIKLGMSAPLTGPAKALGLELLTGIKPVFAQINAQGGLNGELIELVVYDDQYMPEKTLSNTVRLLKYDKVDALFAYVGTPTVKKVLPLIKLHKKTTLYFPFTGADPLRQPPYSEYVRNFRTSYHQETEALVNYFIKNNLKNISVFYQVDAYGGNGWFGVKLALEKHGLQIASDATYSRGTSFSNSFESEADLILAGNPDAIIVIGSYEAAAGFIRDVRSRGKKTYIANISFVGAEALIDFLKKNKITTDYLIFSHVVPNPMSSQSPAAIAFRSLVHSPSFMSFEGYLNAKLMIEILKNPSAKRYNIGLGHLVEFPTQNQANNQVYLSYYDQNEWVAIRPQ